MSNLSYCRFNNTALDLRECAEVIEEMEQAVTAMKFCGPGETDADEIPEPLSEDELRSARDLAASCVRILLALARSQELTESEIDETFLNNVDQHMADLMGERS